MLGSRCFRWGGFVSVALLMVAFMGNMATGQPFFRHPQPGDIYKEYKRSMIPYYEWRVTDPNASYNKPPWLEEYRTNTVLYINIGDLEGAIRAEAVIDLWQGHSGTTGKKMKVNNNDWINIPELYTTPGPGQCYFSQPNVVVDVPLSNLFVGTNAFEGRNEGQTCYDFGWGQHGWNGIIFRIYYASWKEHPTGSITSPSSGSSFGDNPTVSATASGGAGIQRVDFIAYYDGLDTDGDGVWEDWHYYYHRSKSASDFDIKGHVGTAWGSPYSVTWNTDWVPDQASGSVKMIARIQDYNGVWFVTDPVDNLTLTRSGTSVKLYKPYDVPEDFDVRADDVKHCHFDIPYGTDLSKATGAKLVISSWNSVSGGIRFDLGQDYNYSVNSWHAPVFGEDHFWSLDFLDIPWYELREGQNTYDMWSSSLSTEITTHWPGPMVIVRYGGVPVPVQISSFTATSIGADGVRLNWKTLSETNNYGFEVQRSASESGSYVTLANGFVKGAGTTIIPQEYSFTDASASGGIFYYRLKQIDLDGTQHLTDPVRVDVTTGAVEGTVPLQTMLAQNYPNPFNPTTVIRYGVAQRTHVTLTVYNTLGEIVSTLVDAERPTGYYDVQFNARGLASGVYLYRLVAGDFTQINKLVLVR